MRSEDIELICSAILGVASSAYFVAAILNPAKATIYHIAASSIGLNFGFYVWVAYLYGNYTLPVEEVDLIVECYILLALYLASFTIVFMAKNALFKNQTIHFSHYIQRIREIPSFILFAMSILVWTLRVARGQLYGIWFSGTGTEEAVSSMPYYFSTIFMIGVFLSGSIVAISSISIARRFRLWSLPIFILVGELYWAFLSGRRPVLILILVFIIFFVSSKPNLSRRVLVVMFIMAIILSIGLTRIFLQVRLEYFSESRPADNAISSFQGALERAWTSTDGRANYITAQNMSERPLIGRFICKILGSQKRIDLMYGEAFYWSATSFVPSVLMQSRRSGLPTEQLIQHHYRQYMFDTSISLPAVVCADFGLFGGIIGGLILGAFVSIYWKAALVTVNSFPLLSVGFVTTCLGAVIDCEVDPAVFFSGLKTGAIMLVLFFLIKIISQVLATHSNCPPHIRLDRG